MIRILTCLAAACVALASPACAQAPDFYKGKTVRLVVGYGPGGGYDVYARLLAPAIGRALGATIIVENQPGAGGITALNSLVVAPPDGLRIMLANGWSSGLSQLNGAPGVRFDLSKVTHLGIVSASPSVWLVPAQSSLRAIADVRKMDRPLVWSGMSPDDGLYVGARVTCAALKLDCKIVMGYKSSSEAALAIARGETDSIFIGDTSANDYTRIGDTRAMATMARVRSRFFPDLPTIFEAEKLEPEGEWLLDFEATFERLGRILILPAGMPPARLAYLRAAVARAMKNPALIEEGEKTARYIDYVDPEATGQAMHKAIGGLTDAASTPPLRGVGTCGRS